MTPRISEPYDAGNPGHVKWYRREMQPTDPRMLDRRAGMKRALAAMVEEQKAMPHVAIRPNAVRRFVEDMGRGEAGGGPCAFL